jgi:hypothetical protein
VSAVVNYFLHYSNHHGRVPNSLLGEEELIIISGGCGSCII